MPTASAPDHVATNRRHWDEELAGPFGERARRHWAADGAAVWCDPHRWLPEAARLLRPGGQLVFMAGSTQQILCLPE